MSEDSKSQAQRDADAGKVARDTRNDHWKARQDYEAAHAAAKKKAT